MTKDNVGKPANFVPNVLGPRPNVAKSPLATFDSTTKKTIELPLGPSDKAFLNNQPAKTLIDLYRYEEPERWSCRKCQLKNVAGWSPGLGGDKIAMQPMLAAQASMSRKLDDALQDLSAIWNTVGNLDATV